MKRLIHTDDLPADHRFEHFQHLVSQTLIPMEITCEDSSGFRAELHCSDLGAVTMCPAVTSPFESKRTPKMIRRSDPGLFHLILPTQGQRVLTQDRKDALVQPSDLVFYDTSRPSRLSAAASNGSIQGITVLIPRTLISLPPQKIKDLTVTSFSGRVGVGALLVQFLSQLSKRTGQYKESNAAHLGMILIDLLTALLAEVLDSATSSPPRRLALLAQIQAFIQRRLADPALTPDMVSAAHHISTRYLQQLFQDQNLTVSGWIRQRRLERCQRDLANPLLETRPIHAIAERWGFVSSAHFSRVFRTTYGVAPSDYRRLTHGRHTAA